MNYKNSTGQANRYKYQRYARHLVLPEIQLIGQKRIQKTKILFVGAGGLASTTLLYLVSSGFSEIGIIDDDIVEISNLHRQIIYDEEDLSSYKVFAAKKKLLKMNSQCNITAYNFKLDDENADSLIRLYDIIVDSTDSIRIRCILSQVCQIWHRIHIYGAISSFFGHVSVFNYQGGLSYNDIYTAKTKDILPGCGGEGVLSVLPGLLGIIQATEIIKITTGIGQVLHEHMLAYNALKMSFRILRLHPNSQNNIDFQSKKPKLLSINNSKRLVIDICQFYNSLNDHLISYCVIDIRSHFEYKFSHLQSAINISLSQLYQDDILELVSIISRKKKVIIYCNSIVRSYVASKVLWEHNIYHVVLKIA